MTPPALLTIVRQEAVETTAAFWTDLELFDYMWHGEMILAAKTNCTETQDTSLTSTSGTAAYTTPSGVQNIMRVEYDGVRLKRINRQDRDVLDGTTYGSTLSAGNPESYIEFSNKINLYPTPDATGTQITIFHAKKPVELTSASGAFTIPDQVEHFQIYLKNYMLWRMFEKDKDHPQADRYKQAWDENLQNAVNEWGERQNWDRSFVVKEAELYDDFNNTFFGGDIL